MTDSVPPPKKKRPVFLVERGGGVNGSVGMVSDDGHFRTDFKRKGILS